MTNYIALGSNMSTWAEINFYDPQNGGGANNSIILPNSVPFPFDTPANDDNIAMYMESTLVVSNDATVSLGFLGDDANWMQVSNQTWTGLNENITGNSYIENDRIVFSGGSGNNRTVGSLDLTAGSYPMNVLWWENSGGSHLDVFQANYEAYSNSLPNTLIYRSLSTTSAEALPDLQGLQLGSPVDTNLITFTDITYDQSDANNHLVMLTWDSEINATYAIEAAGRFYKLPLVRDYQRRKFRRIKYHHYPARPAGHPLAGRRRRRCELDHLPRARGVAFYQTMRGERRRVI